MKPARSNAHGGTRSRSRSFHGVPATASSASASLLSLMFLRTAHEWLAAGALHTRPVQSVSCHGTRAVRSAIGRATAPGARALVILRFLVAPSRLATRED